MKKLRLRLMSYLLAITFSMSGIAPLATAAEYNQSLPSNTGYNHENDGDYLGYLPGEYYSKQGKLTDEEKAGLQTWYFWTGGNDKFFRDLSTGKILSDPKGFAGTFDFLKLVDARPSDDPATQADETFTPLQRKNRFKTIGVINDPGCTAATKPDEYGLWLDKCDKDPHSSGIMGARKFKNPNFEPAKWDVEEYYKNGSQVEPPYRIGLSCGICHISFNPLDPPKDFENPDWKNISGAIGNQYIREGGLFGRNLPKDDFIKELVELQPPGTSDTSRNATDHIDNPNVINSIFNLKDRPTFTEKMNDGSEKEVYHILKDGSDSVGLGEAAERVYVNIGVCSDEWLKHHEIIAGVSRQTPFSREKALQPGTCDHDFYIKTASRMDNAAEFLKTIKPYHLADAPGGRAYLTKDDAVLTKGKKIFANNCAKCHSSKQPPADLPIEEHQAWFEDSVLASNFLDHNFLSTDERHSVTEVGTNAARAVGTNAAGGHIWNDYSSKTYKELPPPEKLELENPLKADKTLKFKPKTGGYYRVPSLISVWSSAPLLLNNSVGTFTGDPSVSGRMEAFNDAIEKLMWPEKRDHVIKRTRNDTQLNLKSIGLGAGKVTVPEGTPAKLVANLDPNNVPLAFITVPLLQQSLISHLVATGINILPKSWVAPLLLKLNTAPDFVEDRGHLFGTDLPDEDKQALIEFIKTF
ncbi:hypothetical protein [Acaryochloris sp. IP29b_bin.137]|uniref:hypothetical protein n=1 Tax=Acaryochloris sp. IP29b_bin.137 TaxID=2969217 RepID=UPI002625F9EA|nr:hypothetical protein [Acaryochloris sp. IP29b_bin.137]